MIDMTIRPRPLERDKGLVLRRVLGNVPNLAVGPFILFDDFGPFAFDAGAGFDAPPHPHCGIAPLSYLFTGNLRHRNSLGNVNVMRPGEMMWTVTGSGIAHSERTPDEERGIPHTLAGVQLWVALPR